jgi:hypothetical protein
MKTQFPMVMAGVASLFLAPLRATATLYLTNDPNFGLNSVTVDTSTQLGWLNVGEAKGLSYQQVLADTHAGGLFSGFRFATVPEVVGLYSSAGIPGLGIYPWSTPSILSLLSLIGTTGPFNELRALSSTQDALGLYCAPAIDLYGYNGGAVYQVNDGGYSYLGTSYAPYLSYPDLSSWLVKTIPEPGSVSLLIWASASLVHFHRSSTRKKVGGLTLHSGSN